MKRNFYIAITLFALTLVSCNKGSQAAESNNDDEMVEVTEGVELNGDQIIVTDEAGETETLNLQ